MITSSFEWTLLMGGFDECVRSPYSVRGRDCVDAHVIRGCSVTWRGHGTAP